MSTILRQRNITIQENIKRTENVEDMRTFLKCLHNVRTEIPEEVFRDVIEQEVTDRFKVLWKQISGSDTLDRFNSTYNLPEWRCGASLIRTQIKSIPGTLKPYTIFTLIYGTEEYILVVSSFNCKDIYFDRLVSTLRQIDGVREAEVFHRDDAVFNIDFNKL